MIDWHDPNLRFIDLDGDGLADLLIAERRRAHLVPARWPRMASAAAGSRPLGPSTTSAARAGLRRRHADRLSRRHDRRRARPTSCASATARSATGRTSATAASAPRSTMDDAPRVRPPGPVRPAPHPARRHRRLRHDRPPLPRPRRRALYFNQSGNGWARRRPLRSFPRRRTTSLDVSASTCSATAPPASSGRRRCRGDARAPVRYVDLMGGSKPHLLVRWYATTSAPRRASQYAPSTQFYLADKRAGPAVGHAAAVPGARASSASRRYDRDQPQPLRHPLRLPPRLLRRRRARVPRLRDGRAVGHRGLRRSSSHGIGVFARRRRRRPAPATGAHQDVVAHRVLPRTRHHRAVAERRLLRRRQPGEQAARRDAASRALAAGRARAMPRAQGDGVALRGVCRGRHAVGERALRRHRA